MSSNNKESLNEMVNRLTLENEQLKQISVSEFINHIELVDQSCDRTGQKILFRFAINTAQQFLKNRG